MTLIEALSRVCDNAERYLKLHTMSQDREGEEALIEVRKFLERIKK